MRRGPTSVPTDRGATTGTKIEIATLALAAALTAGPAYAQPQEVPYGDLNLATPHGQAVLQGRLNRAARKVCRFDDKGRLVAPEKENACYRPANENGDVRFAELVAAKQRGG